jgi:hypothetical protein
MPHALKPKAALVSLAAVAALAFAGSMAVRAKIRDEGARSVASALDAAFGRDGWGAESVSFDQEARVFSAERVTLRIPPWALAGSGEAGAPPVTAAGPLSAERLVVRGPAMPMRLNDMASKGFAPEGPGAERLFEELALEGASFSLRRGDETYRAEAERLVVADALLEPPSGPSPPPLPEAVRRFRARSARITGLAVYREGAPAPLAKAGSASMLEPGLLRPRPGGAAPGVTGLLTARETRAAEIALDLPGLAIRAASLVVEGPLYGAGEDYARLRGETAAGLSLSLDLPGDRANAATPPRSGEPSADEGRDCPFGGEGPAAPEESASRPDITAQNGGTGQETAGDARQEISGGTGDGPAQDSAGGTRDGTEPGNAEGVGQEIAGGTGDGTAQESAGGTGDDQELGNTEGQGQESAELAGGGPGRESAGGQEGSFDTATGSGGAGTVGQAAGTGNGGGGAVGSGADVGCAGGSGHGRGGGVPAGALGAEEGGARPSRITFKAESLQIRGGDMYRLLKDLIGFGAGLPPEGPEYAIPLSILLVPPFSLERIEARGISLAADGSTLVVLERASVEGPLKRGEPAAFQRIELSGLVLPGQPLPFAAPWPAGGTPAAGAILETRYSDLRQALAVPEMRLELDGLFEASASLSLEGTGPGLLEDLASTPLLRPQLVLQGRGFREVGASAFSLDYSDRGLARALLAPSGPRALPDGAARRYGTASPSLSTSAGILAISRLDPYALNAPEIVDEITDFLSDPRGFSVSAEAAGPVPLDDAWHGPLARLLGGGWEDDRRPLGGFLSGLRVSASSAGRPAVTIRWREVPTAFSGSIRAGGEPLEPQEGDGASY